MVVKLFVLAGWLAGFVCVRVRVISRLENVQLYIHFLSCIVYFPYNDLKGHSKY